MLAPSTVAENISLGRWPTKAELHLLAPHQARRAKDVLDQMGVDIDPSAPVGLAPHRGTADRRDRPRPCRRRQAASSSMSPPPPFLAAGGGPPFFEWVRRTPRPRRLHRLHHPPPRRGLRALRPGAGAAQRQHGAQRVHERRHPPPIGRSHGRPRHRRGQSSGRRRPRRPPGRPSSSFSQPRHRRTGRRSLAGRARGRGQLPLRQAFRQRHHPGRRRSCFGPRKPTGLGRSCCVACRDSRRFRRRRSRAVSRSFRPTARPRVRSMSRPVVENLAVASGASSRPAPSSSLRRSEPGAYGRLADKLGIKSANLQQYRADRPALRRQPAEGYSRAGSSGSRTSGARRADPEAWTSGPGRRSTLRSGCRLPLGKPCSVVTSDYEEAVQVADRVVGSVATRWSAAEFTPGPM